ncbi:MAG: 3-dehydroquinate synthase family protein [Oscillospiraceae bacterium]
MKIDIPVSQPYRVDIAPGLLDDLGRYVSSGTAALVVTEEHVAPLLLERACRALRAAGVRAVPAVLPAGEETKSLAQYAALLHRLAEAGLTRADTVVALGGGVIGDLAGFAAATWLRGIRLVQVPTTLLAMVDSSVGGKTAIDLPEGKNLVGAFHQPAAVVCDPQLLDTLPSAILRDGCAEALKTAVLFDPDLFSHLAARHGLRPHDGAPLRRLQAGRRVRRNEFDRGARQLLNLGHTAGHHRDTQRLPHFARPCRGHRPCHNGAGACRDAAEIEAALIKLGLPTRTEFSPERLAQAALADKKRAGERITLVIPRAIGDCVLREVPVDTLPDIFERGM